MKIENKKKVTGGIIYSHDCEENTIKRTVESAIESDVNLSHADFSGADFSSVNFSGVNFSGAYLSGANFSGAYLSGANFSGADFSGATIKEGIKLVSYRPIISISCLGSRDSFLTAFNTEKGIFITTGCKIEIELESFVSMVKETHKGGVHELQYLNAINFIKSNFEIVNKKLT